MNREGSPTRSPNEDNPQVIELFLAAVELPEDDREAYLDRMCSNDVKLREELISLLAYYDPKPLIEEHSLSVVELLELPLRTGNRLNSRRLK